ncbi:MAG: DUF2851 family protein [Bacteroidales bacterium]
MEKVPEKFLHYLWKYRLFEEKKLQTTDGENIEVVDVGLPNTDSGPDFQNAKIKIGKTLWAGNVEIHINSADWYHHGHDSDKAYDNVILQVVLNNNQQVKRTTGENIPTTELKFPQKLFKNYESLLKNEAWVPCEWTMHTVDPFIIDFWLSKLTIERLEDKSGDIEKELKENHNNWETTFYHKLARNFGFKVNSEPFELLAKSIPLKVVNKHKDSLFQLEALFFGQAGFLDQMVIHDQYHQQLFKEYQYLKKKWHLKPMEKHLWKFARLRPGNFPTVRIAQFCALIHQSSRLFSHMLEKKELREMKTLFKAETSAYWHTHYRFSKETHKKQKNLGDSAFHILVINTLVPFLFLYGQKHNKQAFKERALDFLLKLPPEKNSIISKWQKMGIDSFNAYYTQALLQLKNNYCDHKRCLDCQIGNALIKKTAHAKKDQ